MVAVGEIAGQRTTRDLGIQESSNFLAAEGVERRVISKGRLIYDIGTPAEKAMFLVAGVARNEMPGEDGESAAHLVTPISLLGEGLFSEEKKQITIVRALTDCEVVEIQEEAVRRVVVSNPDIGILLAEAMVRRLQKLDELLVRFRLGKPKSNTAWVTNERIRLGISDRISFARLAEEAGLERHTVLNRLHELQADGVIEMDTTRAGVVFTAKDEKRLEEAAKKF